MRTVVADVTDAVAVAVRLARHAVLVAVAANVRIVRVAVVVPLPVICAAAPPPRLVAAVAVPAVPVPRAVLRALHARRAHDAPAVGQRRAVVANVTVAISVAVLLAGVRGVLAIVARVTAGMAVPSGRGAQRPR
jgi:hypothetical protein